MERGRACRLVAGLAPARLSAAPSRRVAGWRAGPACVPLASQCARLPCRSPRATSGAVGARAEGRGCGAGGQGGGGGGPGAAVRGDQRRDAGLRVRQAAAARHRGGAAAVPAQRAARRPHRRGRRVGRQGGQLRHPQRAPLPPRPVRQAGTSATAALLLRGAARRPALRGVVILTWAPRGVVARAADRCRWSERRRTMTPAAGAAPPTQPPLPQAS
eukprot:scaffold4074_cov254-Prasinococcus_capsulatus_cf.AAC.2